MSDNRDEFAEQYLDRRALRVPPDIRNEWIRTRQRCPSDQEIAAFDDGYIAALDALNRGEIKG